MFLTYKFFPLWLCSPVLENIALSSNISFTTMPSVHLLFFITYRYRFYRFSKFANGFIPSFWLLSSLTNPLVHSLQVKWPWVILLHHLTTMSKSIQIVFLNNVKNVYSLSLIGRERERENKHHLNLSCTQKCHYGSSHLIKRKCANWPSCCSKDGSIHS